jgi:hypothetical protein
MVVPVFADVDGGGGGTCITTYGGGRPWAPRSSRRVSTPPAIWRNGRIAVLVFDRLGVGILRACG